MKIQESKPKTFKSLQAGVVLSELAIGLVIIGLIAVALYTAGKVV
jgi:hypothetical protein